MILFTEGGSAWSGGGGCLVETPAGRLLLWAVRILLECILVTENNQNIETEPFGLRAVNIWNRKSSERNDYKNMQKQMGLGKSKHLVQLLATVSFGHCRQLKAFRSTTCTSSRFKIYILLECILDTPLKCLVLQMFCLTRNLDS